MAGVMAGETVEETAEVKGGRWSNCWVAEHMPGGQRPDLAEQKTRTSENGEYMPYADGFKSE